MKHRATQGFTLLEMMIALMILGVTAAVVYRVMLDTGSRAIEKQTRYFALWAAADYSDRVILGLITPPSGSHWEDLDLAGRRWRMQTEWSAAENLGGLMKLKVQVRPAPTKDAPQTASSPAPVTLETLVKTP